MEEEVGLERTGAIVCLDVDVDVGLDAEVFWLLGHRVWGKREKAKAKTLGHGHGATGIGTRWQTIVYWSLPRSHVSSWRVAWLNVAVSLQGRCLQRTTLWHTRTLGVRAPLHSKRIAVKE